MVKKSVKKTLSRARSTQDRAQNKMLKELAKDVSELKASVEKKYSYLSNEGVGVQSWDNSTSASRSQNMYPIRIGSIQGLEDINQRVGDVVNVKSIDFRYNLKIANGAVTPADPVTRCRVVLFWDTDPIFTATSGAYSLDTPEWNLLFQIPTLTTANGSENAMIAGKDHDTGKRFQLLHDKTHTLVSNLNSNLTSAPDPQTISFGLGPRSVVGTEYVNHSYKIGRKLRYKAGGTIPINRCLYIGLLSDTEDDVAPPIANFVIKVNYEDA